LGVYLQGFTRGPGFILIASRWTLPPETLVYVDPNIGAILAQGMVAVVLGMVYRFRRFFSLKWMRKEGRDDTGPTDRPPEQDS
jgi:hypothetical protein